MANSGFIDVRIKDEIKKDIRSVLPEETKKIYPTQSTFGSKGEIIYQKQL